MKTALHRLGRLKAYYRLGPIPSRAFRAIVPVSVLMAVGFSSPAGAADKFYVAVSPTAQQTVRYERGVAQLFDQGSTTDVRVMEVAAPNGRIALDIAVLNRGKAPFNLGPENIQVMTADGKILAVIPYERLVAKEESHQKSQRFWSRVAAAGRNMSASSAGNVTQSGTYTGYSTGSVAGAPYAGQTMGTFDVTYHDPTVATAAQREAAATNAAEAQALAARQARELAAYDTVLRTTTIDPGAIVHGTVQFDVPKELDRSQAPVPLQMTMMLNGEVHRFSGQLQKSGG